MIDLDDFTQAIHTLDAMSGAEAEAWQVVRAVVQMPARPPFPPSALGGATNEARALADLLRETGDRHDWQTPPLHSEAMERLIHRLTVLLENFVALQQDCRVGQLLREGRPLDDMVFLSVRPADPPDSAQNEEANYDWPGWEFAQVEYCDECGSELHPTEGWCPNCDADLPTRMQHGEETQ